MGNSQAKHKKIDRKKKGKDARKSLQEEFQTGDDRVSFETIEKDDIKEVDLPKENAEHDLVEHLDSFSIPLKSITPPVLMQDLVHQSSLPLSFSSGIQGESSNEALISEKVLEVPESTHSIEPEVSSDKGESDKAAPAVLEELFSFRVHPEESTLDSPLGTFERRDLDVSPDAFVVEHHATSEQLATEEQKVEVLTAEPDGNEQKVAEGPVSTEVSVDKAESTLALVPPEKTEDNIHEESELVSDAPVEVIIEQPGASSVESGNEVTTKEAAEEATDFSTSKDVQDSSAFPGFQVASTESSEVAGDDSKVAEDVLGSEKPACENMGEPMETRELAEDSGPALSEPLPVEAIVEREAVLDIEQPPEAVVPETDVQNVSDDDGGVATTDEKPPEEDVDATTETAEGGPTVEQASVEADAVVLSTDEAPTADPVEETATVLAESEEVAESISLKAAETEEPAQEAVTPDVAIPSDSVNLCPESTESEAEVGHTPAEVVVEPVQLPDDVELQAPACEVELAVELAEETPKEGEPEEIELPEEIPEEAVTEPSNEAELTAETPEEAVAEASNEAELAAETPEEAVERSNEAEAEAELREETPLEAEPREAEVPEISTSENVQEPVTEVAEATTAKDIPATLDHIEDCSGQAEVEPPAEIKPTETKKAEEAKADPKSEMVEAEVNEAVAVSEEANINSLDKELKLDETAPQVEAASLESNAMELSDSTRDTTDVDKDTLPETVAESPEVTEETVDMPEVVDGQPQVINEPVNDEQTDGNSDNVAGNAEVEFMDTPQAVVDILEVAQETVEGTTEITESVSLPAATEGKADDESVSKPADNLPETTEDTLLAEPAEVPSAESINSAEPADITPEIEPDEPSLALEVEPQAEAEKTEPSSDAPDATADGGTTEGKTITVVQESPVDEAAHKAIEPPKIETLEPAEQVESSTEVTKVEDTPTDGTSEL